MDGKLTKGRHVLEIMLIVVALGMTTLFTQMGPYRAIVLHLFFLPIVVSGYFLGRTSSGVLALFCALAVTIAATLFPGDFAAFSTPVLVGLALTVWAAVLGLTAILSGTLCDERATTVRELHKAYVGVVEVLSKYLQGGNPRSKARSTRIAELSQLTAEQLGLPQREVDNVRVAALLHELGHVEITTNVITRAFDSLEAEAARHTFLGTELVHSLGAVLEGALPLLANQDDAVREYLSRETTAPDRTIPVGARIIQVARAYDDLTGGAEEIPAVVRAAALARLRAELRQAQQRPVLEALARAVERRRPRAVAPQPDPAASPAP